MNPVSPWIAALAEQCLSSYLGQTDQDELQIEDIDGCLCFSNCNLKLNTAVVVSWVQEDNNHRATFTDSKNQIDAIIPAESPDIQEGTLPCPPSIKGGPRHLIELFDIKLVFTYSTAFPDVYLHVNRFKIHHNAVAKGDVPKPKLRKAAGLKSLMTMAYQKSQNNQNHVGSKNQTDKTLAELFASQHDLANRFEHTEASQLLFSQCPSNMQHGPLEDKSLTHRVSIGESSELLGFLAPSCPVRNNKLTIKESRKNQRLSPAEGNGSRSPVPDGRTLPSRQESDRFSVPNQPSFRRYASITADATEASNSATNTCYAKLNQEVDDFIAEVVRQTVRPLDDLNDQSRVQKARYVDNQLPSKKRCRGSTDAPLQTTKSGDLASQSQPNPEYTAPSHKRQRTDAGNAMPTDTSETKEVQSESVPALPGVRTVSTKADIVCTLTTDPWEGMTCIPLSEIDIPKDQAVLLEGLKWIPQDTGVSTPLCHVPPFLLMQWNHIARRTQHLAEDEEQVTERGPTPTPTPQDINTSIVDSDDNQVSENESPARDALPRDTISPQRQTRTIRPTPTPNSTQDPISETTGNGTIDVAKQTTSAASKPRRENSTVSKEKLIPTQQCARPLEKVVENVKELESPDQDPKVPPFREQVASRSLDPNGDRPLNPMQQCPQNELPAESLPFDYEPRGESSDDESDDAEMETSVPFALGGTLPLSSQPEQVITSSGPFLPRLAAGNIQVAETPAINTTRLEYERPKTQRAGHPLPSSQQSSSRSAKTSPISRVLNTYRSTDSYRHSDLFSEASNPSPILEDGSPRVDVLGTQTEMSGLRAPSPVAFQSSSEVVLDSSRPAQRQRGSSIFHLDPSDHPSSFPYASSHSLPMSQINEPSQDSLRGVFALDGDSQLPKLSPREFTAWVATHAELPSKLPRSPPREGTDTRQIPSYKTTIELVARRQDFIGKPDMSAEAQTIYEKFCNDYSPYSGDFSHFAEMCSKLQKMRQNGLLQRSFLWDDFVIRNLDEYPRYFAECTSQDSKTMNYEEFFCMNFSRPQYKKRSLTAHGLEMVASQFVPPASAELANPPVAHQAATQDHVAQNDAMQNTLGNTSFTESLVGRLANLHARSSADLDIGDMPNPNLDIPAATQSSSSPFISTGSDEVEIKEEHASSDELSDSRINMSDEDQKPAPSSEDEDMVNDSNPDNLHTMNDTDMTEAGMDEIEETYEEDDTYHETASIELGDENEDRRLSASPIPPAALGALPVTKPEPPRQQRPWFRSLQNIFPTGPVWSDDPDTPFKRWARQDQNVLQEIKRRGGTRVQVDEKGVICRPTYKHAKDPGS
ncbi:hypothetical protein N7457_009123 [Penicillium paradoxum]|uniref:uncharacterized protein n=1 Tax=Penicillium paradoxum TaxID=176176 RepID=UPI002549B523|nr:uncharacterized protein N7457_009123 [Penicillium paradoxum]KAJ5774227.1 hypothetical protein N7457_009123 [Penicillium paradoxum]